MDYRRLYETEIFSDEGPSFKAMTIPRRSLADISPEEIISSLDLKSIDKVESGRYIRAVVTALAAENESDIINWRSFKESALNEKIKCNQYLYELAEYVTMSRILAFGNPPLMGHSTQKAKDYYKRQRPFVVNKEPSCSPDDENAWLKMAHIRRGIPPSAGPGRSS